MAREDDIVYLAYVDDKTLEFFERFDRNIERTAVAAEQGFDKVDAAIRDSGQEAGILAGVFASLTNTVVGFGLNALAAIKDFVAGSVELRARVDVLGTVVDQIGGRMGKTTEEIRATEESIKSMGITTQAARNSMLLMARANIDWSEAAKLARVAQDAAVVAGINSSQAFERLVRGIQKQEPELLDELGIQLRRTDAYAAMARQLGKTTKELTEAEKAQAILNAIYEQSAVVAGSYEAAMGDVGKQITSLPRYIEEVQLALGGAFQQSEQAKIHFYTQSLKEMQTWLKENEQQINKVAALLGTMATKLYEFLGKVLDFAKTLPGGIETAGLQLAQIINNIFKITDQDLTENTDKWKTTFLQLISIVAGGLNGVITATMEAIKILRDTAGVAIELLSGDVSGALDELDAAIVRTQNLGDTVYNAVYAGFEGAATAVGLLSDNTADATQEAQNLANVPVQEPFDEAADAAEKLKAAVDSVNDSLDDLLQRQTRAAEDLTRQTERNSLIESIRNRFRVEDIERSYSERVTQIWNNTQEARIRLAQQAAAAEEAIQEQHSERLQQIEESLQERLQDIQESFSDVAQEAARQRDAVALLAAMRERDRQIEDAQETHDEQLQDAQETYQEQQQSLQESLAQQQAALEASYAEQIEAAREARWQDYDNMTRDLQRQRELKTLYDQFDAEDRDIAFQRQLEDMGEQFASMEGLTEEGLAGVLEQWEAHFGDLTTLMETFRDEAAALTEETVEALTPYMTGQSPDRIGSPQTIGGTTGNGQPPVSQQYAFLGTLNQQQLLELAQHMGMGATAQALQVLQQYNAAELRELIRQALDAGVALPAGFVIGQGGQMSMGLANYGDMLASSLFSNIPQVPATSPQQSGVDRREIRVTVDGAGLDPYFQRMLVQTLTEVERNRGT